MLEGKSSQRGVACLRYITRSNFNKYHLWTELVRLAWPSGPLARNLQEGIWCAGTEVVLLIPLGKRRVGDKYLR